MPVSASFDVQMQFSGSAGAWTNVTTDVLLDPPLNCSYGIGGTGPTDRVAQTGVLNFALNNSPRNSGGKLGYYSPNNANCRAGFEVGIGVRLAMTYSGSTFYKFRGSLEEIGPVPGLYNSRLTYCTAVDWMDEAAKQKIRLLATQINQRSDQVIATVVGAMTRKPAASALDQGRDIFPYAIDNNQDTVNSPMTVFQDAANSELGFVFVKGDQTTGGVLIFQNRHARPKSGSALSSFTDSMVNMRPRRPRSLIFNRVRNVVHPRRADVSASILFTLRTPQRIPYLQTITVQGNYVDPSGGNAIRAGALSTCTLTAVTDYTINTASDGSGGDLTTFAQVAGSFGGNSFQVTACNNFPYTADTWLTLLQVRGRGLYDYEPITLDVQNTLSSACYGDNVLPFDMPYQTDATGVGKDAANYLLGVWGTPQTRIDQVHFIGNNTDALMAAGAALEISDRITLNETVTGIAGDYYIQKIDFQIDGRNTFHFQWLVSPKDPYDAWIIGVTGFSELGTTTLVGY